MNETGVVYTMTMGGGTLSLGFTGTDGVAAKEGRCRRKHFIITLSNLVVVVSGTVAAETASLHRLL